MGTHVNPADLMTKLLAKPKIEQLMKLMGYRFVEQHLERAVQIGVLTATWSRKLGHGVLAGDCDVENDTDYCEVKIRRGINSVNSGKSRSQSVSRIVRHVPEAEC